MPKQTFEEWMKQVDVELLAQCHLASGDLPDWRYYDDYEDGVTPKRSAKRAIKYANES